MSHSLLPLLGHDGAAFAWHDVSLQFGIKCCSFLGRGSRTTTWLGMTICFVSGNHIVDSQPLILNTFEYNGMASGQAGNPGLKGHFKK